jgi:hypothetical protein
MKIILTYQNFRINGTCNISHTFSWTLTNQSARLISAKKIKDNYLLGMAVCGPSSQSRPPVESLSLPLLSLLCIR